MASFARFVAVMFACCFSLSANAAPPSFSATFSPDKIGVGNETTLIFSIINNDSTGIRDIAFTNTLPAGVILANPVNLVSSCSNATVDAVEGDDEIIFSGASLTANSHCALSVSVTSNVVGTHTNTTSDLTSDQGNSGSATDDLVVDAEYLMFDMSTSPSSIVQGEVSTLTIDINNPSASAASSIRSTINLPNGLQVADVSNLTTNCNDTLGTTVAAETTIVLNDAYLLAGAGCQITVDIMSTGAIGELTISSSIAGSTGFVFVSNYGVASTSVDVSRAFATMSFSPNPVTPDSTATLSITLTNYERSFDATNVSFSNDLDATLAGLVATGLPLTNVCGTGSVLAGTSTITLSGGTINAGSSCTIEVPISVPLSAPFGTYLNTTSTFTYDLNGSTVAKNPATGSITVTNGPQLAMEFQQETYAAGEEVFVDFTLTNIDTVNAASNISFTANATEFTAVELGNITTLPANNSCGAGSIFASNYDGTNELFTATDLALAVAGQCTFSVGITLPAASSSGVKLLSTSNVNSTISGSSIVTGGASDTISVVSAPQLTMSLADFSLKSDDSAVITFNLSNNDTVNSATDINFTLDLDGALTGLSATLLPVGDICGAGSTISGTGFLSFASGSLGANSSCNFDVTVTLPSNSPSGSVTLTSSVINAIVASKATTNIAASSSFEVSTLTSSMVFVEDNSDGDTLVLAGDTVDLTFTLTNTDPVHNISNLFFTLNLSQVVSGLSVNTLPADNSCGTGSSMTGTSFLILTGAGIDAGSSCQFTVTLDVGVGVEVGTYNALSSTITFDQNSATITSEVMNASLTVSIDEDILSTISSSVAPLTSISPIPFQIAFSEEIEGLEVSDFSVVNGTANNLVKVSDKLFTFDIVSPTDGATTTVQLLAGNVNELGVGTQQNIDSNLVSVEFDTAALPSAIVNVPANTKVNSGPATATVTYINATEHFLTSDKVNLYFTGTASTLNFVDNETSNSDIVVINGDTANPTITISNLTGDGDLTLGIDAATARNAQGPVDPIANSSEAFSVDNTAPTVSISSAASNPINSSFNVLINFTDTLINSIDTGIVGFAVEDISLTNATLSNFSGSNGSYSATVNPISDGVVALDINAGIAQDAHGNNNLAATKYAISYDTSKPTVSVSASAAVYNSPFTASINFSDDMTGFDLVDLNAVNASLSAFSAISASEYSVLVTPSANGNISLSIAENVAQNAIGNLNQASNVLSVSYDIISPAAVIASSQSEVNGAFSATIDFTESVTGFDINDLTVSNATLSAFTSISAQEYSVIVTPQAAGSVTLVINANVATDIVGNANLTSNTLSVTYDNSAPGVVISSSQSEVNGAFLATIDFTESVTGFDINDLTVTNATLTTFTSVTAQQYTVLVTPQSSGSASVSINADVAIDAVGNFNLASNVLSVSYDNTSPEVVISSAESAVNGAFSATIEFTEDVTGFDVNDFMVTNAALSKFTSVTAQHYTVLVTPQASGNVSLSINANVALDKVGNLNLASNTLSVTYNTDKPTLEITSPGANVNAAFVATFTFSEQVTGFDVSDVNATNASLSQFDAISAIEYTVLVTPIASGEVTLVVYAGAAQNMLGNLSQASNTLTLTYDASAPIIISTTPIDNDSTVANNVAISFNFNKTIEAVSGSEKRIEVLHSNTSTVVASYAASSENVLVQGNTVSLIDELLLTAGESYYVLIDSGAFADELGNLFAGIQNETEFNFTLANSAPIAMNDDVEMDEDTSINIDVLVNDIDEDDNLDSSSITIVSFPENGVASIADGKITYKPTNDFFGVDSFSYTVNDALGIKSNEATVSLVISNVNDLPVLTSETNLTVLPLEVFRYQLVATDVDRDAVSFDIVNLPTWISFDGIDTIEGTATSEDIGKEFTLLVTITDEVEKAVEYELTIAVGTLDETLLKLTQTSTANLVLVGEEVEFTYSIENQGPDFAILDSVAIEIDGTSHISDTPESCVLNSGNDITRLTCFESEQLAAGDSLSIALSLTPTDFGTGEITSKTTVSQITTDTIITDKKVVVVAQSINDNEGQLFSLGFKASDHALGDLDNDGLTDIILVSSTEEDAHQVLLNKGAGQFELSQSFGNGLITQALALNDINNDGFLDVVAAHSQEFASGYYLNNGFGRYDEFIELGVFNASGVVTGDFNSDGLADIVYSLIGGSGKEILLQPFTQLVPLHKVSQTNDISNSSNQNSNILIEDVHSVAVASGDFDGDGTLDLAFAVQDGALELMLNDGAGTFTRTYFSQAWSISAIEVADINADGLDDMLIVNTEGTSIILGGFIELEPIKISNIVADDIAVADIDNDDVVDIYLINEYDSIVSYRYSDGVKSRNNGVIAINSNNSLSFADLDSDGDLDIILTSDSAIGNNEIRFNQGNGLFGEQTVDIEIDMSAPEQVTVDDSYQVSLTLANIGLGNAEQVQLEYSLSNGEVLEVVDNVLGCEVLISSVACSVPTIDAGEVLTIDLSIHATTLGEDEHNVVVSVVSFDDNQNNNHSVALTVVNDKPVVTPPKKKSGSMYILIILLFMIAWSRKKTI
ncbi:Ig-like domain-containing protein [Colwellia sp. RSH04]|uniref:Ig-like domain-containing protein n=1 Tax=Colwellia sp. RSH04 TaxID=2305464 RepID=UPI0015FDEA16|nr:Ig-like domain-containing protein [Colwellia sp. RSH04]